MTALALAAAVCTGHFCVEAAPELRPRLERALEEAYEGLEGLPPVVRVTAHPDFDSFRRASGGDGRLAAKWRGDVLHLAPVSRLEALGILGPVLRHELAHLWVGRKSAGRAPRWLEEGICVWRAGELRGEERAGESAKVRTYRRAGAWVREYERRHGRDGIERLLDAIASGAEPPTLAEAMD